MTTHKITTSKVLTLGVALMSFHLTTAQAQAQGSAGDKAGAGSSQSQNAGSGNTTGQGTGTRAANATGASAAAGNTAGSGNAMGTGPAAGNATGTGAGNAGTNATRPQNVGGAKPASSQTQATIKKANDKSERKIQAEKGEGTAFAMATLEAKSGSTVTGTVQFNKVNAGLKASANIAGGKAGRHGIHIHEKGDCSAKDASSAGGHFNPLAGKHAGPDHKGRHVGDLGNITVQQDGKGLLSIDIPDIKGFDWSQIIGKSVVIHEKGDDFVTQPSGDSGARIACGIITDAGKTAP